MPAEVMAGVIDGVEEDEEQDNGEEKEEEEHIKQGTTYIACSYVSRVNYVF